MKKYKKRREQLCVSVNTRELKNIMKDHSEANRRWTLLPAAKRVSSMLRRPKELEEMKKFTSSLGTHTFRFVFQCCYIFARSWVFESKMFQVPTHILPRRKGLPETQINTHHNNFNRSPINLRLHQCNPIIPPTCSTHNNKRKRIPFVTGSRDFSSILRLLRH